MECHAAVPFVAGTFSVVYVPSGGRYLNDHTLVLGPDGTWHVYGITDESTGMPFAERQVLHAVAPGVMGPWTERSDVLVATGDESVIWAPFAFQREQGQWTMYYWAGTDEPMLPYRRGLRRCDSVDLVTWARRPERAVGGRDPFVLRVGGRWLLYSVDVDQDSRGRIVVSESDDLVQWTDPSVVITDPVPSFGWGNLESPFVVAYGGSYFLFLTRTGMSEVDYSRTLVFRSRDPLHFDWQPITDLRAHAAEIVHLPDDEWFVTSAGWTSAVGENRGLSIARLEWAVSACSDGGVQAAD